MSMGGLFHADIRRRVWPKLVGVNMYGIRDYKGPPLEEHKDRAQVLLDVNRCSRRIPERERERQSTIGFFMVCFCYCVCVCCVV